LASTALHPGSHDPGRSIFSADGFWPGSLDIVLSPLTADKDVKEFAVDKRKPGPM